MQNCPETPFFVLNNYVNDYIFVFLCTFLSCMYMFSYEKSCKRRCPHAEHRLLRSPSWALFSLLTRLYTLFRNRKFRDSKSISCFSCCIFRFRASISCSICCVADTDFVSFFVVFQNRNANICLTTSLLTFYLMPFSLP